MAYKKDQGRYARMVAFWAIFLLFAYGCFGELRFSLNRWIADLAGQDAAAAWVENFPLLGTVNLATVITLVVVALLGWATHRILNRPQIADLLIDTESELKKVTWPSASDTVSGTLAVIVTVVIMLVFLTFADFALGSLINALLSGGASS